MLFETNNFILLGLATPVTTTANSVTLKSVTLTSPVFWAYLVASLVLHESAHLVMAYVAGVRVKHIGLSWKGPYIVRESALASIYFCAYCAGIYRERSHG
jgi:hypothetical protein